MILNKQSVISLIKKNLNKFDQFEFCNTGGWPDFSSLDIIIYSETETENGKKIRLTIFYTCVHSSACACYSTTNSTDSLTKEIFIGKEGAFEVLV